MPRESSTKTSIVNALRLRGYWARRVPQNELTGGGLPDILAMLRRPAGRACWLEVKRVGQVPTRLQQATMDEITRHGGCTAVVHTVAEALAAVSDFEGAP